MDDLKPTREETPASPLRPLLIWLGPLFAVSNLSLVPCFATMLSISLSRAFFKGATPPPEPLWLPFLEWLSLVFTLLVGVQVFFVTLCITWSPDSYWRRFVEHWLIMLACAVLLVCGAVMAGAQSDSLDNFWRDAINIAAVLAALPILLLGGQTPFWLARLFFGCRLQHVTTPTHGETQAASDSLTLRDMFVGTSLIAVSLGLLQIPGSLDAELGGGQQLFLFSMLFGAASCCGISLVFALPQAILFLTLSDLRLAWAMTLAAAGSFAVGYFWLNNSSATSAEQSAELLAVCCSITYVTSIGSGVGLTLLRRSGWRMVTRWSDSRA